MKLGIGCSAFHATAFRWPSIVAGQERRAAAATGAWSCDFVTCGLVAGFCENPVRGMNAAATAAEAKNRAVDRFIGVIKAFWAVRFAVGCGFRYPPGVQGGTSTAEKSAYIGPCQEAREVHDTKGMRL